MSQTDPAPLSLPVLARSLLHRARIGTLSTASATHEGWPFGSLAPYAMTATGDVALVLSDLAEHTKNARRDPRASLFVHEPVAGDADPQSGARIALLGKIAEPGGEALIDARARYIARFSEADGYLTKLDFRVYVMTVEHVRLVGGFGRIAWLPASVVHEESANDPLAEHALGIVTHMNDDHAEVMGLYLRAFRGRATVTLPRMVSVDAWGFDIVDRDERFRFDFDVRCETPDAVRKEVVRLAKESRALLASSASDSGIRE